MDDKRIHRELEKTREELEMFRLSGGSYQPISASDQLKGFSVAMAEQVLSARFDIGETENIRRFRQSLG